MRYKERNKTAELALDSVSTFTCNVLHESMSDVNNKRSRPNSPCKHVHAGYRPIPVPGVYGDQIYLNAPANSFAIRCQTIAGPLVKEHYDRAVRKMQRLIDKQIGDFSTLNFLYELRELPDLFRKITRPQDLRYIDFAFAIIPTLSDIRAALRAYNAQVADLNEKLKKFRSIECVWTKRDTISQVGSVTYFAGNDHVEDTFILVTTRMRGSIEMDVPVLSQVSPDLFRLLDDLQVDVSAGNAWNALPWSWLIDWFVPVGDWLDSLPSGMKPAARFVGTISVTINAHSKLTSAYTGPGYAYRAGYDGGELWLRFYERKAFASPLSSLVRWRFDPISKPGQIAILRDIMYPVKPQPKKPKAKRKR